MNDIYIYYTIYRLNMHSITHISIHHKSICISLHFFTSQCLVRMHCTHLYVHFQLIAKETYQGQELFSTVRLDSKLVVGIIINNYQLRDNRLYTYCSHQLHFLCRSCKKSNMSKNICQKKSNKCLLVSKEITTSLNITLRK